MKSNNNIVFTADEVVARYAKTVNWSISGRRLDPHDHKREIIFILGQRVNNEFSYDTDVVELYSLLEVRFFVQSNKYLFEQGLIAEYEEEREKVDFTNMLTDEDVYRIAASKTFTDFLLAAEGITSPITLERIMNAAEELNRPKKLVAQIRLHIDSVTAGE